MADAFRNKRYYRVRLADSSLTTFDDTDDAVDKISFTSEWDTNSPDRTYALEDSDTTLVMTVDWEFQGVVTDASLSLQSIVLVISSPLQPTGNGDAPGKLPFRTLNSSNAGKIPVTRR